MHEHSWFAQDDWRVNQDLTLNLGLRYEYVTTPYGFFSNATSDTNNFAPRLGFAWNPKNMFDGKFVLRGGFALSYDQVFQNILLNVSRNYPRGVSVTFTNQSGLLPLITPPATPTPSQFNGNPELLDRRLFAPNTKIRQPKSTQWNLGVQYQIFNDYVFKAEYIGTKGSNLVREVESNIGYSVASGGTGLRQDTTKGSVLIGQGIANSIYHAGQFTFEKRYSKLNILGREIGGLVFNTNYTYSMFISESDDVLGGQANRTIPADSRFPELDRARSAFDQPHRFVANFVWETPELFTGSSNYFAKNVMSRVLGGWQLSAVGTYASGTPFSVLNGNNASGILGSGTTTVQLSQRVSVNPNGIYPLISTGATKANPLGNTPNAYFIVNAAN